MPGTTRKRNLELKKNVRIDVKGNDESSYRRLLFVVEIKILTWQNLDPLLPAINNDSQHNKCANKQPKNNSGTTCFFYRTLTDMLHCVLHSPSENSPGCYGSNIWSSDERVISCSNALASCTLLTIQFIKLHIIETLPCSSGLVLIRLHCSAMHFSSSNGMPI